MANLKDVARLAGYDPSTVSRVLSDAAYGPLRSQTKERILWAAKELNYRPNSVARSLRTKRTGAIALLVPELDNPGFSEVTHGVSEAAQAAGYLVMIGEVNAMAPNLHERLVLEGRVDGILAAYANLDDPPRTGVDGAPFVALNRQVEWATSGVTVDDQGAARMAVDHFVSLGHRRIGHITGSLRTDTGTRRERGFLLGLTGNGLTLDDRWLVQGDYTEDGGYRAALQIACLAPTDRPTALLVGNLVTALGMLRAFRERDVRIPDDISVIVFDEHPIAAYLAPALTTIKMPLREMGALATRMLIGTIKGETHAQMVMVEQPSELVERASVARSRDGGR
jgi:LacI family transcriptional regulator